MIICIWLLSISIILVNYSILKLHNRINELENDFETFLYMNFKEKIIQKDTTKIVNKEVIK